MYSDFDSDGRDGQCQSDLFDHCYRSRTTLPEFDWAQLQRARGNGHLYLVHTVDATTGTTCGARITSYTTNKMSGCSRTSSQSFTVSDTTAPSLSAPADKTGVNHVEGCDTSAISGLIYSESAVTITAAQL